MARRRSIDGVRRSANATIVCTLLIWSSGLLAGEISGLRSQLPLGIDPELAINFSNDFLGRGGSVDDFRTTQLILSARFGDRWLAVFDHSTLTLGSTAVTGRIDQSTLSVGYRLFDRKLESSLSRLDVGGGLRRTADLHGERMQNGFHRIISSDITVLPYVDTRDTNGTAWFDAEHQADIVRFGTDERTRLSYWLRANSLLAFNGQWDSSAGAYLVGSRGPFEAWFGVRHDWRRGYDQDFVQTATALAEEDTALVLGLRFGALVLETVQQFNNEASYGQLKLVSDSSLRYPISGELPEYAIELGFLLPDVHVQLAARRAVGWWLPEDSQWRQSLVLDFRFGEPQFGADPERYVETVQFGGAMEWERPLSAVSDWISIYGSGGLGWRQERLTGDGQYAGIESEAAGRITATATAGLRFTTASLGGDWRYRLQLGMSAWAPLGQSEVFFDDRPESLHAPALAMSIGMTFDYR